MRDKELYQQILGLTKPWAVKSVELDKEKQQIEVKVALKSTAVLRVPTRFA